LLQAITQPVLIGTLKYFSMGRQPLAVRQPAKPVSSRLPLASGRERQRQSIPSVSGTTTENKTEHSKCGLTNYGRYSVISAFTDVMCGQLEEVREPQFGMHRRPELLLFSSSQTSGSSNVHCLITRASVGECSEVPEPHEARDLRCGIP